jgi:hypothetical protein
MNKVTVSDKYTYVPIIQSYSHRGFKFPIARSWQPDLSLGLLTSNGIRIERKCVSLELCLQKCSAEKYIHC